MLKTITLAYLSIILLLPFLIYSQNKPTLSQEKLKAELYQRYLNIRLIFLLVPQLIGIDS